MQQFQEMLNTTLAPMQARMESFENVVSEVQIAQMDMVLNLSQDAHFYEADADDDGEDDATLVQISKKTRAKAKSNEEVDTTEPWDVH